MIRWAMAAACALLVGCSPGPVTDPADPSAYAVRLAVVPAPGGAVQRIDLPAEALAALRSPNRGDIRLFDGAGTALPMAITGPSAGRAAIDAISLPAFPILGPAGALADEGAELRVEQRDGGRVVTLVRGPASASKPAVLGALFDTRGLGGRARTLRLDMTLPPQQPVDFSVETSPDLAIWTPVGGKILYRREAGGENAIGPEAIPLDDVDLAGRYLRVTWTSPQRLLAPVELRGAVVGIARRLGADDRPAIVTSPPRRIDAHDIRFALPRPMALAAVAIEPAAGEMLVPVTIHGRNAPDQGWTPIGSGSLRGGASAPVELSGAAFADYRIEADRRTPGFAAPPHLRLLFEPARLAVLFDGKPPYRLVAGAAGADSRYLPIGELVPGYRPGMEDSLPQAKVAATSAPVLALATPDDRLFSPRKALLWGLLLLGVAALGLMVWRLWRPARAA